jgi:hypothetical protein
MKTVGLVGTLLAFIVISALLNGYVLSVFWGWFIVPVFDVPSITTLQAYGLMLVVGLLKGHTSAKQDKSKTTADVIGELITVSVFVPLFCLVFGYFVHLFM